MWSYVDSQGGWSLPWVRVPGAYSDVTHRNGVANSGGLIFFDSWGGDNTSPTANVNMLVKKEGGKFKYVEKFVKFLRYYGLDGVGINPEGPVPQASALQDFFSQCREYAESIGWQFHVYWYGVGSNGGSMDLGSSFGSSKQDWLWKNNKQVVDMYMLNYDWGYSASSSASYAESKSEPTLHPLCRLRHSRKLVGKRSVVYVEKHQNVYRILGKPHHQYDLPELFRIRFG